MTDKYVVCCYGLVYSDGKVLIVKRSKSEWGKRWTLPGGKLRPGEEFPRCIERAVAEETSCSVKAVRQITSSVSYGEGASGDKQTILIFYLCKYLGGEPRAGDRVHAAIWADEELFTGLARDMDVPYQFTDAVCALCINAESYAELSFDFSKPESILRGMIID